MKKIIYLIILLSATISVSAQDIKSIISSMPENLIYGLDTSGKNILLSDLNDTTKLTVNRGQLGEVTRLSASADFISLKTSDAGIIQFKLLPLINDSQIICVVKTVCGKACDSQIQFYTTKWTPIPQKGLFPTKNKDWFIKSGIDRNNQDFVNAYSALDMNPIKIELSATDTSLKAYYDIKNYLNEDDYKKIEPFLIENPKIFHWDKSSYE